MEDVLGWNDIVEADETIKKADCILRIIEPPSDQGMTMSHTDKKVHLQSYMIDSKNVVLNSSKFKKWFEKQWFDILSKNSG